MNPLCGFVRVCMGVELLSAWNHWSYGAHVGGQQQQGQPVTGVGLRQLICVLRHCHLKGLGGAEEQRDWSSCEADAGAPRHCYISRHCSPSADCACRGRSWWLAAWDRGSSLESWLSSGTTAPAQLIASRCRQSGYASKARKESCLTYLYSGSLQAQDLQQKGLAIFAAQLT